MVMIENSQKISSNICRQSYLQTQQTFSRMVWMFVYGERAKLTNREGVEIIVTEMGMDGIIKEGMEEMYYLILLVLPGGVDYH
jgi:hypothetical protein